MSSAKSELPQSSEDVVRMLRAQFDEPDAVSSGAAEPFAALRSASSVSRALWPDALPDELPAFVLPGHGSYTVAVARPWFGTGFLLPNHGSRMVPLLSRHGSHDPPPLGHVTSAFAT